MTVPELAMKNDLVALAGVYREGGDESDWKMGGKREVSMRQGRG